MNVWPTVRHFSCIFWDPELIRRTYLKKGQNEEVIFLPKEHFKNIQFFTHFLKTHSHDLSTFPCYNILRLESLYKSTSSLFGHKIWKSQNWNCFTLHCRFFKCPKIQFWQVYLTISLCKYLVKNVVFLAPFDSFLVWHVMSKKLRGGGA